MDFQLTTLSSSNESSKKSLLECIVFRWGSLIPLKVTFQGWTGLLKSKLALCLWAFPPIGLMYHSDKTRKCRRKQKQTEKKAGICQEFSNFALKYRAYEVLRIRRYYITTAHAQVPTSCKCRIWRFELLASSCIAEYSFEQNSCLLVSQILDSFSTVEIEDNAFNVFFGHPDKN